MNEAIRAAKEIRSFLVNFAHVQKALEKIGRDEQDEKAHQARVAELLAEECKLSESVALLKTRQGAATDRLKNSEKEADKIKADAESKSRDEALKMHRATKAECERILNEAKTMKEVVVVEAAQERAKLEGIKKEITAARVEAQTVKAELAKLRERIGA